MKRKGGPGGGGGGSPQLDVDANRTTDTLRGREDAFKKRKMNEYRVLFPTAAQIANGYSESLRRAELRILEDMKREFVVEDHLLNVNRWFDDTLLAESTRQYRHLHAVEKVEHLMQEPVDPVVPQVFQEPEPLEDCLATEAIEGRKVTPGPFEEDVQGNRWILTLYDGEKRSIGKFHLYKDVTSDYYVARRIHTALSLVVERYPHAKLSELGQADEFLNVFMLDIATRSILQDARRPPLPAVRYAMHQTGADYYLADARVVMKGIGIILKPIRCFVQNVIDAYPPPKLPSSTTFNQKVRGAQEIPPHIVNPTRSTHQQALDVVKFILSCVHGKHFVSPQHLDVYILHFQELFMALKKVASGNYRGKPLITRTISLSTQSTTTRFNRAVLKDLGALDNKNNIVFRVPKLVINTAHYARWSPLKDGIDSAFEANMGIKYFVKAGARLADKINDELQNGEPPNYVRKHNDAMRQTTFLSCYACGRSVLESMHEYDTSFGFPVCPVCFKKAETERTKPAASLRRNLNTLLYREKKSGNLAHDVRERLDEIIAACRLDPADFDKIPLTVKDGYIPTKDRTKRAQSPSRKKRNLKMLSVEAIWTFIRMLDGLMAVHGPGNIDFVALWENLAKNNFMPAIFLIVKGLKRDDLTPEQHKDLMDKVREMWRVMLKSAHSKAHRAQHTMTEQQWKLRLQEMRKGMLAEMENGDGQPWGSALWFLSNKVKSAPKGWKIDDRTKKLVEEIVADRDPSMPEPRRGKDGCPFPGNPDDMPEDWSWWYCWCLFGERLFRMWLFCNGKWILIETIETIYLEVLFQWCRGRIGRGFLYLTWVAWLRHPLRFAVAHHIHGLQMLTSWILLEPRTLHDRDDYRANINVQTAFENFSEADADDERINAEISADLDEVDDNVAGYYTPDEPWIVQALDTAEDLTETLQDYVDRLTLGTIEGDDAQIGDEPELKYDENPTDQDADLVPIEAATVSATDTLVNNAAIFTDFATANTQSTPQLADVVAFRFALHRWLEMRYNKASSADRYWNLCVELGTLSPVEFYRLHVAFLAQQNVPQNHLPATTVPAPAPAPPPPPPPAGPLPPARELPGRHTSLVADFLQHSAALWPQPDTTLVTNFTDDFQRWLRHLNTEESREIQGYCRRYTTQDWAIMYMECQRRF